VRLDADVKSSRLGKLYILPEEIKNILSSTAADSSLESSLRENMVKSFQSSYDFYNYTGTAVRVVGQDNLEISIEPTVRPDMIDPGIVISKTLTTYYNKSIIDPRCRTNAPTDEFEQAIAKEIQNSSRKTITQQRTVNKDSVSIRVLYLIPIAEFENTDTVYDNRSNYLITMDNERTAVHPNNSKNAELRDVLNVNDNQSTHEASIKYLLIDNTNLHPQLYINTGCNILCVKSMPDPTRETGLYVYSVGNVESQTHRKAETVVVKFDVDTILSEKLFAYHSYAEAKAAGNLDERYKEREKRQQAKSAQDEKVFKNTEADSKREDRMREERSKKIADGIKLATVVTGFVTMLVTTIVKTNTKTSK